MRHQFIIIDNQTYTVPVIKKLLRQLGYEIQGIWPDSSKAFTNWDSVFDEIEALKNQGWDPEKECCILFLDLALNDRNDSFNEGLARIAGLANTFLDPYVKIIHTLYPTQLSTEFRADYIDGIIDKSDTQNKDSRAAKNALRRTLMTALKHWEKRTDRSAPESPKFQWRLTDSPSARRAEAALTYEGITELVEQLAERWSNVEVSVLTGGYSGSYLLKVEGKEGSAPRSVVCKIARDRNVLEQELESWKKAASSYKQFVGLISPVLEPHPQHLGIKGDAWFVVQSTVPGLTLEESLNQANRQNRMTLETLAREYSPILQRLFDISAHSIQSTSASLDPSNRFYLTSIDLERFDSSASQLSELAQVCIQKGYFSDDILSVSRIQRFQREIVHNWKANLVSTPSSSIVFHEQHGDLNPRNLILSTPSLQLIDFARFGLWPIGYDLIRLQMQLLLRLIHSASMEDVFPEHLPEWIALWHSFLEGDINSIGTDPPSLNSSASLNQTCLWFLFKLEEYLNKLFDYSDLKDNEVEFRRCAFITRTFEAIKMCSYQDSTWFKRLWFLLIAVECAQKADLVTA